MSENAPKKRLTRFALLIAFVAFLAACLWGRAQIEWVNERREVTNLENDDPGNIVIAVGFGGSTPDPTDPTLPVEPGPLAPWTVRMLGEEGVAMIWIDSRAPAEKKSAELARLRGLFPEADVSEAPPQALPIYDAERARGKRGK